MSPIKKALMLFIGFFLLIGIAYAQDFSLSSGRFYEPKQEEEKIEFEFYNGTYNICENEKKFVPILVVNKDNVGSKYALDASGVSWASLNVQEFFLPKKQSGVVFLELKPGSNTEGKYMVGISAFSSAVNARRDLNFDVNVDKCYSIKLELEKEEDKVCGGVTKQYGGEITNNGKQKSDVELTLRGPNWASSDKNTFSIEANDKESLELSADVPSNAKGIFNIVVGAAIKNQPFTKSEKKLSIEVVPKYDCYKADVISDAKIVNSYSNEFVQIKIRNSGIKQANYDISAEAPGWIGIEPKKLIVNPEQFGNLNLNINPDAGIPEGTYQVKINVKFDDMVYQKNIDVVLSKNKFLKALKSFLVFYQYYIYLILLILIILLIFRRQISNKIKTKYKNYKTKQARLRALKAARKARQLKKQVKEIEKAEFEVRKINKYRKKWILFFVVLIITASASFLLIYLYNFPVSKEFVKSYWGYFIVGILISVFVIFLIEFYKPLFKLLKKIK